eukprot:3028924-Lingulodinium_polyedra.AAC.1
MERFSRNVVAATPSGLWFRCDVEPAHARCGIRQKSAAARYVHAPGRSLVRLPAVSAVGVHA